MANPGSTYAVTLPVMAAGMTEAEVVEVLVIVGQSIQRDQQVITVETEKVQLGIEAPVAGSVREICVAPGSVVAVGETLVILDRDVPVSRSPGV